MNDLLLLGRDAKCTDELAGLIQHAGYQVVEVKDVLSCGRQLRAAFHQRQDRHIPAPDASPASDTQRGITMVNADAIDAGCRASSHEQQLRDCIVTLARQLTPGWRLSMRHRHLETPDGAQIALTTLEFLFVKMFTLVEAGQAVSRKQIVQAFGENYLTYDQNRIDTMVRRLRQKTATRAGVKLPLNTERVRGFSFGALLVIDP